MKKLLLLLLFCAISNAHAIVEEPGAWNKRNYHSKPVDTSSREVSKHGAPSTASSFEFGLCAASIVNTMPATAQRLYNDAKARGEVNQFKAGFLNYVDLATRDPVVGWRKGDSACTGHMLQSIRFDKQDRVKEEK